MSKIVNTTRGLVRPTRDPDTPSEALDVSVTATGMPGIQGLTPRPPTPVERRPDVDETFDEQPPQQDEAPAPLPGPRGLAADLPIGQIARISAKSPVSSMAVAELIGALELHGRRANGSHAASLAVLGRIKTLLDHVTERRSWPRVPRVRRRLQRRRRDA